MHIHTIQLNIEALEGGIQHMDATEFGAYMSLLICCYKSNNRLLDDDKRLSRMARVSMRIWKKIKPIVLEKFIISNGYVSHARVQKELDKYQKLSLKNRDNALKNNKSGQPVASQSHSQKRANTNNNKQITNNNNNNIPPLPPKGVNRPDDVSEQVWNDFVKHRKKKKADITETALNRIQSQAAQAGWGMDDALAECVARGWTGFKAEWVNEKGKGKGNGQSYADRADRAIAEALAEIGKDSRTLAITSSEL